MSQMDEFGLHEVMHMSLFLCEAIDKELLQHEQIKSNAEWKDKAKRAHQALFDLYQSTGAAGEPG